jgi:primosomal replication protein N
VNQLRLVAAISERDVLRYTPAGIPIVTAVLQHVSDQVEAGITRRIDLEIAAIAAGEISGRFNRVELGQTLTFTGFLARKRRHSKSLVFHITDFEAYSPDH